MLSLWWNNFIVEKSVYFPVIPDNLHNVLGHDTSRSVVFCKLIFWHHRSRFTQNTFIFVLSVVKFVLGNVQKEFLIMHY